MTINWKDDYMTLRDVAAETGVAYTTLHTWAINDKLKGAIQRHGTRWFVHKKTVELIKSGELDVSTGKGD